MIKEYIQVHKQSVAQSEILTTVLQGLLCRQGVTLVLMFMLMTEVMAHYPLVHALAAECLSNGVTDDAETFVLLDTFVLCAPRVRKRERERSEERDIIAT